VAEGRDHANISALQSTDPVLAFPELSRHEEYMADVFLTARRALTELDFRLFRYRHLLGASSNLCAAKLGMRHEACEQRLQEIESLLGRTWRTLAPYALYSPSDYFRQQTLG
jgi:hypothetical protein